MDVLRGAEPRSVFASVENQMDEMDVEEFGERRDEPEYLEINYRESESSPNSCEEPRTSGSYRAELKRPDLKGSFRCSICGKVFCHSSSLSRHRMQAHFKSYKCTLCRKDITSNETLRTHMYKQHQISRMFMCRCCNWAFPDKTSLHMHIQAREEGKAVSVPVIGKGLAPGDGGERSAFAPIGNPLPHIPPPPQALAPGHLSFFPAGPPPPPLPPTQEDLGRLRDRLMLNQLITQQSFGLPWLSQLPKPIPTTRPLELCRPKEEDLEINVDKDEPKCDDEEKMNSSDTDEPKSESSAKSPCVNAESSSSASSSASSSSSTGVSSRTSSPVNLFKKDNHGPSAFHHLSVDSLRPPFVSPHISPSETNSSVSPNGGQCFDCAVSKTKLIMTENKCRYLESRANTLQAEAVRAQSAATAAETALRVLESETRALREHTEQLQRRLLDCQEQALRLAQSDRISSPQSVALFLNQLIQSSIVR